MKKVTTNEIKTGIMVIACVGVVFYIMFKIGALKFGETGYNITAAFSYASGIEMNAPVRLAGVSVGEVKDIKIEYSKDPKVLLTLWLQNGTQLREDSTADINTMGLMGEKYVELSLGTPDLPVVKPGAVIKGEEPFQMDKLLKKSEAIADNLDKAITDVRALANNVNGVVSENKDGIKSIVSNLESTSKNLDELSQDIKAHPWKLLFKGKEAGTEDSKTSGKK